ncbi:MAG: thiamine-binding protein [Candidatus Cloacimonadota bacterium]|nr:MAG: thiamine-binding protein [Candidatus Cloacimonadota bacterium]RLC53503.1 MAG: thiamine-binding protein [Candidatus Cloacimonadota bacterium]HHE64803.1 MTH1187 family thiamine-binding protein [Bacteroidota bacterium]
MNNQNVICELVMVTYDIGPSLSPFVAKVIKEIKKDTKVKHILTPMGSVLEGQWKDVMSLVDDLFQRFSPDFERIGITMKIDYRRSKQNRIEGKIKSVEEKL